MTRETATAIALGISIVAGSAPISAAEDCGDDYYMHVGKFSGRSEASGG